MRACKYMIFYYDEFFVVRTVGRGCMADESCDLTVGQNISLPTFRPVTNTDLTII